MIHKILNNFFNLHILAKLILTLIAILLLLWSVFGGPSMVYDTKTLYEGSCSFKTSEEEVAITCNDYSVTKNIYSLGTYLKYLAAENNLVGTKCRVYQREDQDDYKIGCKINNRYSEARKG